LTEKKLTAKQEKFITEYLVDFNATQASIRAGYSAKTANRAGAENLSKPVIAAEIEERKKKEAEKHKDLKKKVLDEYVRIAFLEGVELKGADKMKALEFLAKYFDMSDETLDGRSTSLADSIRRAYEQRKAAEESVC